MLGILLSRSTPGWRRLIIHETIQYEVRMLAPEIRHPRLVATGSEESKINVRLVEEVAECSVEHIRQN